MDGFGSSQVSGSLDERPVTDLASGMWFDGVDVEKISGVYLARSQHLGAQVRTVRDKQPEKENKSSGGVGLSAEAKTDSNGNSKAQVDISVQKQTEGGVNFSANAGAGVQKDSKGNVSTGAHGQLQAYYSF